LNPDDEASWWVFTSQRGSASGLDGTNQKDYTHYVVVLTPTGVWRIESGWSYVEDAQDQKRDNIPQIMRTNARILTKTGAKREGLNPDDEASWWVFTSQRGSASGLDEVSPRTRQGTRVRFNAHPGSLVLYTHHPEIGEEGSVTTMPGFGKRTYLPGPGGGLLYVDWDQSGTIGVSPKDVEKANGKRFAAKSSAPSGPASGFGREKTEADYRARIAWESWAAQTARQRGQEGIAQGHDLARKDYEKKLGEGADLGGVGGTKAEKLRNLDAFTQGYIEAALWSSTDNADDSGGEPLDANYDTMDLTVAALDEMIKDSKNFQEDNAELLSRAGEDGGNGHDFWLTRNRHGAGFWDRGYDQEVGKKLTDAAHAYGSVDLTVSGGKIHHS
jgi:hypothetical protein